MTDTTIKKFTEKEITGFDSGDGMTRVYGYYEAGRKINQLIDHVEALEKRVEEMEFCNCIIKRPDGITKVCRTCHRKVKI